MPAKQLWNDILDIIFPRWCAGCGEWDEDLCAHCLGEFSTSWFRVEEHLPYLSHVSFDGKADTSPFAVLALADYAGPVARAIVRWKNVTDRRLDWAFEDLIATRQNPEFLARAAPTVVVPAPSSSARIRSGCFVTGVMGKAVADLIDGRYENVLVRKRVRGGTRMDARERKSRAIDVVAGINLTGYDVVLVDDVVTTGATLAGASRAVKSAGGRVIAAMVIAATHDPRQMRELQHK
ncbi:putative amidophosphoribosyltransferase [Trueperella bonasi]|uniref:Amidophosphoribosyltransferase n=1 Tax=Trueperella bonasi TaxID=312286 RepID=A0ABT9NEY7_9ACTO|nr:phosphoribosyltransferase family protein [Trueperella bonasi]MDP9805956.1 putative amidophosphoribosyltransferase [Trueperella bonasi]